MSFAFLTDLDDTLFDHSRATRAALLAVRERESRLECWTLDELERRHHELLEIFHLEVLGGRLSVEEARLQRFRRLLIEAGGDGALARTSARAYRDAYEESWQALPGAPELLRLLKDGGIPVVVVTNNSLVEQRQKLDRIGLAVYVDVLVTSEETGSSKPEPAIFEYALARAGVSAREAVMLGNAWAADIEGARGAGLAAVWLNRFGLPRPDPSVPELQTLEPAPAAVRVLQQATRRSA